MEVYEGQQLKPPTISLLTAADIIPMTGDRWNTGFDLINEGPEATDVFAVCPTEGDLKTFQNAGANEAYVPFVLYATDTCSTFPAGRDFYGRAQRKLLTGESTVLETELWTGAVTSQPHLADGAGASNVAATTTIPMTATSAKEALALLEQEIGEASATRGMIHLRPQVLIPLLEAQVIRRVGNVYLSPMDNIVVPGRGYPGTGPAAEAVGATEWMFGHPGMVQIRHGEIIRLGENDPASQVIRSTNDRQVLVERIVSVALDSSLGVFAIEFNSIS